jgi:hypothetical protein
MAVQFFYDNQIRRFLLQFTRMVSNFQVQFGKTDAATSQLALQTVPVFYGDASRQAAQILARNSENVLQAVPAMAFYISSLQYDRQRMQEPNFIGKMQIRERMYDPITGMQTDQQGDTYTVERPMPVPYLMTIKLDIWTSNTEQKLQLIEQIATLFNPALEIQSTDNYIDWTSLSYVLLTDMNWSSRTVPVGTEDPIDIATMTFELPVWIAPPAKVTQMGVIQKIINSVYDSTGALDKSIFDEDKILIRRALTVLSYGVVLIGNKLRLVSASSAQGDNSIESDDVEVYDNDPQIWRSIINQYGSLENGISQIRLDMPNGGELVGTVAYDPTDDTSLLFGVVSDTVPVNTLTAIDAVVNPHKNSVIDLLFDNMGNYQVAAGTRYLILGDIDDLPNTDFSQAWNPNGKPLVARANDIVYYDGNAWQVVFDSNSANEVEYVTNTATGVQLRWTGAEWIKSYEGLYREAEWRIVL